jgi:hypothetical protein
VVMVRILQWYGWMSMQNSAVLQVLQGCHQCQRGILLVYLQTKGRVCLVFIDGKINTMRVYLFSNDSGNINNEKMMAWKEQQCKISRRSDSDCWIIHPEFSMAIRFEFRQEERAEEENKYQMLDLSVEDQQSSYSV